jgi:hypothetical protein
LIDDAASHLNGQTLDTFNLWHALGTSSSEALPAESTGTNPTELDISPLYALHQLKVIQVSLIHPVSLTLSDLEMIPTIWTNLVNLYLSPELPTRRPPSINHNHIVQLVQSLPSLVSLGLKFDASHITKRDCRTTLPSKLKTLCTGASPIRDPSRVVEWIQAHFPHLETLSTDSRTRVGENGLYKQRWAVVMEEWEEARGEWEDDPFSWYADTLVDI